MTDKKMVPQIRFKGFSGAWEERKLGDVGNTFTGLTGKTKEDFGHGSAKFVTYVNVFQNPIATLDQLDAIEIDEKQNQVQKGDIFFTTSSETPEEVGMSSVWTHDTENVYLNSFTFGYRPRVSFDLNYMASMLRSPSIRKKITFLAQGISRYNISKTKMLEIEIPTPTLSEQEKIGSFFKELDDTIALHQRKLDLLKEQKKGYLQKMFPKNGAKVPELRFAGFADDWEQRRLKDVTDYFNGKAQEDNVLDDGLYELITLKSVSSDGVLQSSGKYVNDATDFLQEGTLIMTLSEQNIGAVGMTTIIPTSNYYVLNQRVAELRPNSTVVAGFLTKQINRNQNYFEIRSAGTKVQNISKGNVENFTFEIPNVDEQEKIGAFFKQLDDTITLHQHKLDLLKEQKKGFLQKMFV
ncbi:restriction endonuclease subunit S [Loigolactobacillus coryniformis]|uniref:Restriction endonuclease subunit S n=1 Tax=Loigolactobacillus coryniformis TaxID=1610 RepID=A0A5B8TKG8_9LACO|nr:restriction endonuclease subunit S [Loigolactobacillus coryniformis]QEA53686.1 restriction endonuclease subunit S [Loigolactobacillus coryniformis]